MPLNENALTTVDRLKLPIDNTSIEIYINAASDVIENYCNTKFNKKPRSLNLKPDGGKYLMINYWNIESVEQILNDDEEITEYTILAEKGMLYKKDEWPELDDYDLEVNFTAGFILPKDATAESPSTLPGGIENACILIAQDLYWEQQRNPIIESQSRGGVSTKYLSKRVTVYEKLPGPALALLKNWRFTPC